MGGVHGADIPHRNPEGEHLPNPRGETGRREGKDGEVAEWLKAHAWKVCLRETVTRVRIPLSPPNHRNFEPWPLDVSGVSPPPKDTSFAVNDRHCERALWEFQALPSAGNLRQPR